MSFVPAIDPPGAPDEAPGLWFCVRRGDVLVVDADIPLAPGPGGLGVEAAGAHFLGRLDGVPCWAADVAPEGPGVPGAHGDPAAGAAGFLPLRALFGRVRDDLWTLAGRAVQIVEWDRTHRFCGRCATPTEAVPGERARRCPACGLLAYPRLAPAVIVLVERDGAMLLARGANFPTPMYSTLAGFVEPGEGLEEAVHREVGEEVGIALADVTYFGSQPWPFPHSLMIGFTAGWAGGELRPDETEILDAGWFTADDLPRIPPRPSIARLLIDDFLARQRPGLV